MLIAFETSIELSPRKSREPLMFWTQLTLNLLALPIATFVANRFQITELRSPLQTLSNWGTPGTHAEIDPVRLMRMLGSAMNNVRLCGYTPSSHELHELMSDVDPPSQIRRRMKDVTTILSRPAMPCL